MAVRDWIDDYIARHKALTGPHDWPLAGSDDWAEYIRGWALAFIRRGVTEAEADAASARLAETPPKFQKDHLPAVLAVVEAARAAAGNAPAQDRESALHASKGCDRCGGSGLVSLFHPDPANVPPSVGAHCTCPYGRWVRAHTEAPDLRRIPDLADPGEWRLDPPGLEPIHPSLVPTYGVAALIRDWTARARDERPARRRQAAGPAALEFPGVSAEEQRRADERRAELARQFESRREGVA